MHKKSVVIIFLCFVLFGSGSSAYQNNKAQEGPYKATWESLYKHNEAPEWFRDAKLGIYFHWGVYSVPDNQKKVLLELGHWLTINGEAVYNTRPWKTFGEGPTRLKIRFTQSKDGKTLYAIVLGWPGDTTTLIIKSPVKHMEPD